MAKRKSSAPQLRAVRKGTVLIETQPIPERSYTMQFSDPSREVTWDQFWDEMYTLLLPLVIEQTQQQDTSAQEAA